MLGKTDYYYREGEKMSRLRWHLHQCRPILRTNGGMWDAEAVKFVAPLRHPAKFITGCHEWDKSRSSSAQRRACFSEQVTIARAKLSPSNRLNKSSGTELIRPQD